MATGEDKWAGNKFFLGHSKKMTLMCMDVIPEIKTTELRISYGEVVVTFSEGTNRQLDIHIHSTDKDYNLGSHWQGDDFPILDKQGKSYFITKVYHSEPNPRPGFDFHHYEYTITFFAKRNDDDYIYGYLERKAMSINNKIVVNLPFAVFGGVGGPRDPNPGL